MPKKGPQKLPRTRLTTFGPAILVTLIGFLIAYQFVNPAPPRTIVIATGTPEGAYYLYAQRYKELLAADGINLELRNTAGSIENIRLLEDESEPVDLALVQGGTSPEASSDTLVALASLYYEPLWVFTRNDITIDRLPELSGMRIAIGEEGSGVRAISLALLADNFIDAQSPGVLSLGGDAAAEALRQGEIEAAFFVAAPDAPLIQALLHADNIRLMNFARASAYTRIHHFLSELTLPEGVIDLQINIPQQNTALLAPTANLVARANFHPALVSLLLQTATKVHGAGGLFENPGAFPSPEHLDFPLDDDARRYLEHGPPLLQRYLPFWTANLLDRLKIMLLPLVTLLIPLFKIMPPAYRWRVRKKIYHWYDELQEVDIGRPETHPVSHLEVCLQRLDKIEEEVRKVQVPLSYADELYDLRLHLGLIRSRLQSAQTGRDSGSQF